MKKKLKQFLFKVIGSDYPLGEGVSQVDYLLVLAENIGEAKAFADNSYPAVISRATYNTTVVALMSPQQFVDETGDNWIRIGPDEEMD